MNYPYLNKDEVSNFYARKLNYFQDLNARSILKVFLSVLLCPLNSHLPIMAVTLF